jgi:hypothetical protein
MAAQTNISSAEGPYSAETMETTSLLRLLNRSIRHGASDLETMNELALCSSRDLRDISLV